MLAAYCGDLSDALDAVAGTALYGHGGWQELQELYLTKSFRHP